jgi:hypothetical protein
VASIWLDEVPAVDDDLPVHGGPADVLERIRSGAVPENEQDRIARRQERDAELDRQARREARENVDVLLAKRGEGFSSFGDVATRAVGIFQAQDRRDRQTDRQLTALGETLHVERKRLAKLERDLAERSADLTRQLAETNSAHRSRFDAQERLRQASYAPYRHY